MKASCTADSEPSGQSAAWHVDIYDGDGHALALGLGQDVLGVRQVGVAGGQQAVDLAPAGPQAFADGVAAIEEFAAHGGGSVP